MVTKSLAVRIGTAMTACRSTKVRAMWIPLVGSRSAVNNISIVQTTEHRTCPLSIVNCPLPQSIRSHTSPEQPIRAQRVHRSARVPSTLPAPAFPAAPNHQRRKTATPNSTDSHRHAPHFPWSIFHFPLTPIPSNPMPRRGHPSVCLRASVPFPTITPYFSSNRWRISTSCRKP